MPRPSRLRRRLGTSPSARVATPALLLILLNASAAAAQFSFQVPADTDVGRAPREIELIDGAAATFVVAGDEGLTVLQRSESRAVAVTANIKTAAAVRALALGGGGARRSMAWATNDSTDLTIAPVSPRGTVGAQITIPLPGRTSAIAAIPLGDGDEPVFAVAHSKGISLLRGDADNRFRATEIAAVEMAADLQVSDLNGDGKADLIAVDEASGRLSILLGDGAGGFRTADEIPTNVSPTRVAASDLDEDSSIELFAIGTLGLSIHERNRRGDFETPRILIEAPHLSDLAIADFDRDGHLDVAYTNRSRGTITFLFSRDKGKLDSGVSYMVGHGPEALLLLDNGAAPPDVVVVNELGNSVTYLRNRGDGRFAGTPAVVSAIPPLNAIALADFDLNSHLDMALLSAESGRLQIFLGNARGTFEPLSSQPIVQQPLDAVAADFDGDGRPDLAVVDFSSDRVALLEGNGRGRFAVPILAPAGHGPAAIVHGDFGGTAGNDLAVANRLSDSVTILHGDSRGNFTTGKTHMVVPRPSFLMVADTNGDGRGDIIAGSTFSESIAILAHDKELGLAPAVFKVLGEPTVPTPAVDIDGDGIVDLITTDVATGEIQIHPGLKGGGFGSPLSFRVGRDPARVASGDFDGDGALDLAVLHNDTGVVAILRNSGKDK